MERELKTECSIPVYDPNKPAPDWESTSNTDAQEAKKAEQSQRAVKTYVLPWMGGRADGKSVNGKMPNYNPMIVNNTATNTDERRFCNLSMIMGIASVVLLGTFFLGFVLAVMGIVFGIIGLKSNISDIEKKRAVEGIVFSGITMSTNIFFFLK